MSTESSTPAKTVKVTVEISSKVADLLSQEAQADRRSRKAHIELILDKHADRFERRSLGAEN